MNRQLFPVVLISFSCFTSLQAEQNVMSPAKKMELQADHNVTPAQMDAWMADTKQVAKEYVESLDRGDYGQSWSKGDQLFQQTITQKEWENSLQDRRKKLGGVKSRDIAQHLPAWDPRGLPKGAYMVIEYDTVFTNGAEKSELLTFRRGSDGKWRVLTYELK